MYLQFREEFNLPASRVFRYFETPADWAKLYGSVKQTRVSSDGWYSVPLSRFPFPLRAKNVTMEPDRLVRWVFGGFWRGVGEVRVTEQDGTTVVEGFEFITPHGLWLLAAPFENRFMASEFERIWELGWQRIRKIESAVDRKAPAP